MGIGNNVISISNVNKYYGDFHVLKNINLNVKDGEVLVLLGPSGSGKSTLLKAITGLEDIQSGEIYINNELFNAAKKPALSGKQRSEVGIVFQQFNLYPHMTALENVTLALRKVLKLSKKESADIALPILRKVGLEAMVDKYPSQLSGGEQQRVAIARSLAMKPKVMLFDEPTSALDVELTNDVLNTMIQLSREGMTMVVVTHELSFAQKVASRVAFFDGGEIVESGTPDEVILKPQTQRAKSFMKLICDNSSTN